MLWKIGSFTSFNINFAYCSSIIWSLIFFNFLCTSSGGKNFLLASIIDKIDNRNFTLSKLGLNELESLRQ